MSLIRVTAPAPILTVAEAKKHLVVEHSEHDLLIDGMIQAAVDTIDGAGGWLGRALGPQTWDWVVDGWDAPGSRFWSVDYFRARGWMLQIPLPPLISVELIEYRNLSGVLTPYTTYDVTGLNSDGYGQIRPNYNTAWPDVRDAGDAFRIRFQAGYAVGNGDSPEELVEAVPSAIKAAILLMVGDLYSNRGTTFAGRDVALPMSTTVEALLNPHRVWVA